MTSSFFVEFYSLKKYDTHDEPRLFIDHDYPTVYNCNGHEGTFTFNGYYRVENHPPPYSEDEQLEVYNRPYRHVHYLPQTLSMYVKSNTSSEEHYYVVEIYKREVPRLSEALPLHGAVHKNTNSYSTINDEDGSEMHVCFFPTDEQTLHFKILETLK